VIIENRPGAGATIAGKAAATAEPDGYTLMVGSAATYAIGPTLYPNAGYDPTTAYAPIAFVSSVPYVMITRPQATQRSLTELIAYAKANPGNLNYGASLATPPHLLSTLFKHKAGIDSFYVSYKGSAPAVTDLLAGTTHWTIDGLTILAPLAKDGKLRPLAIASMQRWPDLPDVPTLVESGYPDVALDAWAGVVAPQGTPASIVNRLNALINDILAGADIPVALARLYALPKRGSPADFAAFLAAEIPKWAQAVRIAGAKSN
jgi:tripartite-type tricarboxylate transporter receptor subunit TctC